MGKCILMKAGMGGIDPDELTALPGDVLNGKKAGVSGSDDPVTGTMPNRGAVSQALNAGGSYTIPAGYHNGSGKITANSLASQTSANAAASQILSGQTAWVNGSKITGNMPNRGAISQGLGINGSYTIPAGYHNGSGKVTQSIPVQGGSTTTPGTSNKTIVSANRYVNGNIIVAGSGNLTAGNIKKGVNIFGVTGSWEGYVATARDLYLYGAQGVPWAAKLGHYGANFTSVNFESNQVNIYSQGQYSEEDGSESNYSSAHTTSSFNLTGYNTITMTFNVITYSNGGSKNNGTFVELGVSAQQPTSSTSSCDASVRLAGSSITLGQKTLSLNVSAINAGRYITVRTCGYGDGRLRIYLYKVSVA